MLHYETNNPHVIAFIHAQATQMHQPPHQVIESILEEKARIMQIHSSNVPLSIELAQLRTAQLQERNGVPFSDSTLLIRESRDNEH